MLKKSVWKLLTAVDGISVRKKQFKTKELNTQTLLERLLLHAYNNVPYYHGLFRDVGLVKNGALRFDGFRNLPLLTKDILRRNGAKLVSRDYKARGWFYDFSSGTTGEPIKYILDKTTVKWVLTTSDYYFENLLGVEEAFAKKILFWAPPPADLRFSERVRYTINNALTNAVYIDPRLMTEADMEKYVKMTNSYKPQIIRGYAHALYEVSKFIERRKMTIHKPKLMVSTAEVLHDHMREKIEKTFNARVFNVYGCREVDGIAGECMEGRMHIFAFNNYVEVLDDNDNAVNEGENGKVVVTNLHNYSMPFIRYSIGDMAIQGSKKCSCGNPLPTLEKVTGRICSLLRKKDGTVVSSFSISRIFSARERETVNAYRVVQEDYDRIRVMVVFKERTFVEREKRHIEQKIRAVMGEECKVIFEVVDEIPKSEAGKHLPVQTLLSEVPS